MSDYDLIPERINIGMMGDISIERVPGCDLNPICCPYSSNASQACNVRCARCSIEAKTLNTEEPVGIDEVAVVVYPYWVVSTCGTEHKAKCLFQETNVSDSEGDEITHPFRSV